jgi:hypothetical protein
MGSNQGGQAFSEDAARARREATEELTNTKVQADKIATPRKISDFPCVVAMNAFGRLIAVGTPSGRASKSQSQKDNIALMLKVLDLQIGYLREQSSS